MPYRICTHAEAGDITAQLVELGIAAFAEYEGAPSMGAEAKRWFLSRPGCEPSRCLAALDGDSVVANMLVTMQNVQLGGELLRCGIVDSVATHPAHQRRGLAGQLMDRAHGTMQDDGLDAALLYTNPAGHAYGFYEKLGYVTRAQLVLLGGRRPGSGEADGMRQMRPDEGSAVRELVNAEHADHDGFAPIDEALWRWHRLERPAGMPATTYVVERDGDITATATLAEMEIRMSGGPRRFAVASDLAGPESLDLLRAASLDHVALLLDECAPEVERCVGEMGLARQVGEAAMVLPFSDRARGALERPPGPWYVMVESVVGA
jgi:GNAT superfamily N-acetyltransferase